MYCLVANEGLAVTSVAITLSNKILYPAIQH
jgi:hypothetical protein